MKPNFKEPVYFEENSSSSHYTTFLQPFTTGLRNLILKTKCLTLLLNRISTKTLIKLLLFLCCFFFFYFLFRILFLVKLNDISKQNFLFSYFVKANSSKCQNRVRVIQWSSNDKEFEEERRIFFHETSKNNFLITRQVCAVESAAKNKPDRPVQVFMHTDRHPNYCSAWQHVLAYYPNIVVVLINETQYFEKTPLENWYNKGEWKNSRYKNQLISDYARMLSLHRGGGQFMEHDFITLRDFTLTKNDTSGLRKSTLSNFIVYDNSEMKIIANSIMHFERGHPIFKIIFDQLSKDYKSKSLSFQGSLVMQALKALCGISNLKNNSCSKINILNYHTFFPILESEFSSIFEIEKPKELLKRVNKSFALHVWHEITHDLEINFNQKSFYNFLANIHCPRTVEQALKEN